VFQQFDERLDRLLQLTVVRIVVLAMVVIVVVVVLAVIVVVMLAMIMIVVVMLAAIMIVVIMLAMVVIVATGLLLGVRSSSHDSSPHRATGRGWPQGLICGMIPS
jgi:hypothetical protein